MHILIYLDFNWQAWFKASWILIETYLSQFSSLFCFSKFSLHPLSTDNIFDILSFREIKEVKWERWIWVQWVVCPLLGSTPLYHFSIKSLQLITSFKSVNWNPMSRHSIPNQIPNNIQQYLWAYGTLGGYTFGRCPIFCVMLLECTYFGVPSLWKYP